MTANLLLDTCVLIDYVGRRDPFFSDAEQIVAAGFFGDAKLWVPVQSLGSAFGILAEHVDPALVQSALEKTCGIITPVDLTSSDALRAMRLGWTNCKDCLIAIAAEKVRADYLVTREPERFTRSMVPAISPQEWLEIAREHSGLEYDSLLSKAARN